MRYATALVAGIVLLALAGCGAESDPATNVTNNSATLNGKFSCKAGESDFAWFQYRPVAAAGNPKPPWDSTTHRGPFNCGADVNDWQMSENITGLRSGTQYEFTACGTSNGYPTACFSADKGTNYDQEPPEPLDRFTTKPPPDTVVDDVILGEGHQVNATFHGVWQLANGSQAFTCGITGQAPAPCSSPKTYDGLAPGTYTFSVTAIENGVADPTPATRSFTIQQTFSSADRFVSTMGSDSNPGTSAQPWRTVSHGIDSVQPGQTLEVRGGTYAENVQEVVTPGTASSPVVIRAAAGERPIIQGKFWAESADFWTFDGINVTWGFTGLTNGDQMVRVIRSHDWRWTNSELWNAHSTAEMGIQAGFNFLVDHNYMHDTVPSNNLNQDHIIYASTEGGHGAGGTGTIERNILFNSPNGRGIKINGDGLTVRFNTMVDNLGPSNIQLSDDADDNRISRNILVHTDSGNRNVTRFSLSGSNNIAFENVGWLSSGVVDAGTGLTDGGGNLFLDPQLDSTFHPQNSQAQAYGRFAP